VRPFQFIAIVCGLITAIPLHAADWPQFRGATGNGISTEKGLNIDWTARPPKELWRVDMHDKGYAGAALAAGKVFLLDPDGRTDTVRALDAATGKELWTFPYASVYTPMIGGGDPDWGLGRSTPTYDDGRVYTLSALGILHCLDAEKGTLIWKRDIQTDFKGKPGDWHYVAPPIVDETNLIVCPGGKNASVVALDKMTGKDIWKGGGGDKAGYALPILATLDGKKQIVALTGLSVIGVDAENGTLLWTVPWKTPYDVNASAPVVDGSSIFVCSGEKHGCALIDIKDNSATIRWQNKEMQSQFNAPVLADGFVYGIGDPGNLTCLELNSGKVAWKQPGFEKGGVMAFDGKLIAIEGATGNVVLIALDHAAYREIGRIKPLDGRHWSPPSLADGRLYIRNRETLVCMDLK
jgi:outer membrane protein assembly factor BamB